MSDPEGISNLVVLGRTSARRGARDPRGFFSITDCRCINLLEALGLAQVRRPVVFLFICSVKLSKGLTSSRPIFDSTRSEEGRNITIRVSIVSLFKFNEAGDSLPSFFRICDLNLRVKPDPAIFGDGNVDVFELVNHFKSEQV